MRVVTAGDLILLLSKLPPRTELWEADWRGLRPVERFDEDHWSPLQIYERDGKIRIFFDHADACQGGEYDDHVQAFFFHVKDDVWDRIAKLKKEKSWPTTK